MRDATNLYNIEPTLESLFSNMLRLQGDFDAHNHDGSSSKTFETLLVQTLVSQTILIKKTSYASTTPGIWMGFDSTGTFVMNMGSASAFLKWTGSALTVTGSITGSTITGGTFQTAASGARVVISGAANSLSVYDSVGLVIGIGTDVGKAINITPTSGTNNGVVITSTEGGNGYYYSNSANVHNRGLYIEQTSTGSTNDLPGIEVRQSGTYYAAYFKGSTTAGGIILDMTGTGKGLYITNSGTGRSIDIDHSGNVNCININNSNNQPSLSLINSSTSTSNPAIEITRSGTGSAVTITSNINAAGTTNGIEFNLVNAGAGLEHAFSFQGSEVVSSAVGGSQDKKVRVLFGATVYYIPAYTA